MPVYDYRCDTTGDLFQVSHPMMVKLSTWADLCDVGGFDSGTTAADAPITKLLTTSGGLSNKPLRKAEASPCKTCGGCPERCGT